MEISIATYNIHRCIGTDGIQDHRRTVRVLDELNADVVALQEVETIDDGEPDFVRTLHQTRECHVIPGHTLFKDNAHYGNMLLTTLPVLDSRKIDISHPGREPRGAIAALLDADNSPMLVIATHLGLRPAERRYQVDRLRRELEHHELWERAETRILLGDFNEWHRWGRALRRIRDWFGDAPSRRSFPSSRPLLALDRFWIKPIDALREIHSHRTHNSRRASDHLPVRAVLQTPGTPSN